MTADEIIQRMDRDRLRLDENETTISQTADDRGVWRVWTNDPVAIREMVKKQARFVSADAYGASFDLDSSQVRIFRPPTKEATERNRRLAQENLKKKA